MGDQGLREALEEFCADESSRVVMRSEVGRLLAAHPAESVPRPVIDREAVRDLIEAASPNLAAYPDRLDHVANAVMELARPMPTREQIASVLRDHTWIAAAARCSCGDEYIEFVSHHQADAVLALLNGSGQ